MAKSARQRAMPRTPQDRAPAQSPAAPAPGAPLETARSAPAEPEYLITGTGCKAGHVRGEELDAGRMGTVPSRRRARTGFGLALWCLAGLAVLGAVGVTSWTWPSIAAQVAVIWLAFAAFVVRTSGHRKRCWRTRTWRHAWGGLAPGSGS
jgi:hypothetical protein